MIRTFLGYSLLVAAYMLVWDGRYAEAVSCVAAAVICLLWAAAVPSRNERVFNVINKLRGPFQ